MKRRRVAKLAAAVVVAGFVFQFGNCITSAANIALAGFDFCQLLGPDCTFGPFAPCGDPTTRLDDLLFDCPPPTIVP